MRLSRRKRLPDPVGHVPGVPAGSRRADLTGTVSASRQDACADARLAVRSSLAGSPGRKVGRLSSPDHAAVDAAPGRTLGPSRPRRIGCGPTSGGSIVGKDDAVTLLLVALFVEGHCLLEDVPGVGKTMLAKSLARSLDLTFQRIQFTPDLLPSDVTGLSYFNQKTAGVHVPRRARLRERPPRRRDQPGHAPDAVGAPRGDGGAAGDRRRRDPATAPSLPRARDPEPHRARGHLPAARGAARPLPAPGQPRLPEPRGGAADRPPLPASPTRSTSSSRSCRPPTCRP